MNGLVHLVGDLFRELLHLLHVLSTVDFHEEAFGSPGTVGPKDRGGEHPSGGLEEAEEERLGPLLLLVEQAHCATVAEKLFDRSGGARHGVPVHFEDGGEGLGHGDVRGFADCDQLGF